MEDLGVNGVIIWLWSIVAAGLVGSHRRDGSGGCLYGLFFGPLGVIMAFALDRRPMCQMCGTRLNTRPGSTPSDINYYPHCPGCKVKLHPDTGHPVAATKSTPKQPPPEPATKRHHENG